MTPEKLRDRRRHREQIAIYAECARIHQEQVMRNAEDQARFEQIQNTMNAAVSLLIEQRNAPLYEMMAELGIEK